MANKDTIVADLVFNTLTQKQFDNADTAGSLNAYELYATPDNSLKGNLFDFKWTDHKLNDISWLNADTFSWQSGDVYVAAYNHLVEDFGKLYAWASGAGYYYTLTETPAVGDNVYSSNKNDDPSIIDKVDSGTITFVDPRSGDQRVATRDVTGDSTPFVLGIGLKTETISSTTVTYFQAEDGHKICLPDQESNVQALYEATGVAWYYIIDTANKQFKLPRTKFGFTGLRDSVGGYVEAGLPNITGKFNAYTYSSGGSSGAVTSAISSSNTLASGSQSSYNFNYFSIDASRSSSVYGNSNTVQPEATQMYLYFYVGNFEREAVEQTAGITSEQLNNKADVTRVVALEERDYVVASQEPSSTNAYTWYRKYKSGWVEQGRYYVNPDATWTLPIPMANSNYVITASYISSESTNASQWRFMGITKTATTVTPAVSGLAQSIYICGMAA